MLNEVKKLKRQKVLSRKSNTDEVFYAGTKVEDDFSYGIFECSCGAVQVSNKGQFMYCYDCGNSIKLVSPISQDRIVGVNRNLICSVCNTLMATSRAEDKDKSIFCVQCGSEVAEETEIDEVDEIDGDTETDEVDEVDGDTAQIISLNPISEDTTCQASSVTCILHDGNGENPFWNVIIDGIPTARVSLKDQPKSDEIRDVFASDTYASNLAEAIEKLGVKVVLDQTNAKYYTNSVNDSELADEIRSKLESEITEKNKEVLSALRTDYSSCIKLVLAGLNRNFFTDIDNPLKATLWGALEKSGISNAIDLIESCFKESGDEFFDLVLTKAESYMEKSPELREELSNAIRDNQPLMPAEGDKNLKEAQQHDLAARLATSSVDVRMLGVPDGKKGIREKLQLSAKV